MGVSTMMLSYEKGRPTHVHLEETQISEFS